MINPDFITSIISAAVGLAVVITGVFYRFKMIDTRDTLETEVLKTAQAMKDIAKLSEELGIPPPKISTTPFQPQASSAFPIYLAAAMVTF